MFSADEATHLSQITHFLPKLSPTNSNDPFLSLLAEVVESADKTVLLFVLQVVLEGWGLSHYRRLAKECHHPVLAELFASFLYAEARHHSTGTTLFNQTPVSPDSQAAILDVLAKFLFMVQVGPQNVLSAIEQVKGHLTRSQTSQRTSDAIAKNPNPRTTRHPNPQWNQITNTAIAHATNISKNYPPNPRRTRSLCTPPPS